MPERADAGLFCRYRQLGDLLRTVFRTDDDFYIHALPPCYSDGFYKLIDLQALRTYSNADIQSVPSGSTLDLRTVRSVKLDCTLETPGSRVSFCR